MSNKPDAPTLTCCPPNTLDTICDIMDFYYRLTYPTLVTVGDVRRNIPVEVKIHYRFTRCPGPLAIGNLVYTNTLFPGEKVHLFTSDRRTRFTFDSSTQLSYRNAQSSEESFYAQSLSDSMFDITTRDEGNSSNTSHSHVDGHAEAGVNILGLGGSASMSGNFDAHSTADFMRESSQHAEQKHHESEMATRKASSVSVGEVQSRSHAEGQSEDHFESSSREFSNPNHCHAITFLFYQINKTQTVKFSLEAIDLRVIDPAGDVSRVQGNQIAPSTSVGISADFILATSKLRQETAVGAASGLSAELGPAAPVRTLLQFPSPVVLETLTDAIRQQALNQVTQELIAQGLLDKNGQLTPEIQTKVGFEKQTSLPTPGVIVKSCLDECGICEPDVEKSISLDLERKQLENALLKKQIDLLDKSQEYRCCPADDDHAPKKS